MIAQKLLNRQQLLTWLGRLRRSKLRIWRNWHRYAERPFTAVMVFADHLVSVAQVCADRPLGSMAKVQKVHIRTREIPIHISSQRKEFPGIIENRPSTPNSGATCRQLIIATELSWFKLLTFMGRLNQMRPRLAKVGKARHFPAGRNLFPPSACSFHCGKPWARRSDVLMNCRIMILKSPRIMTDGYSDVFMDNVNRDVSMRMMVSLSGTLT